MTSDAVSKTTLRWSRDLALPSALLSGISLAAVAGWYWWPERQRLAEVPQSDIGQREGLLELARGRRAAAEGEFEAALQHVENSLASEPESIPVNLLKAELLFRLHRTDEMRFPLELVLNRDPDHFEAHANLAFALRFCGQLDTAAEHVEWCLDRRPDFVPARRIRAEILRDGGDSDGALAEIREVIAAVPGNLDCHLLEAELLMYRREFELAFQNLLPLEQRFRGDHRFVAIMARLSRLSGRNDEVQRYQSMLEDLANPAPF